MHAETIQIDYDPAVLSYPDLLEIFWQTHNPFSPPWSPQYRSAVFYSSEEQGLLARESRDRVQELVGREIQTEIEPLDRFWPAEDYHQKYRLQRNRELMREYRGIFPDFQAFRDSTAVARVNGYLDGYGNQVQLEEELELLGLSPAGEKVLLRSVRFRAVR
ncbi:MAG: hypothetical protein Kow00129_04370 [Thermoleophilia bacterium]